MFFDNMELYVANVGDAQAILMQSDGGFRILTRKHDPAEPRERQRIRQAGGYVSRHGKLNDVLEVSRAFGYIQMMPAVMAAPDVMQLTLKEQDEMILIASKELWDYVTPEVVVDVARSERADLMRASQKLRDLAMAFGATGKLMVMMIGISDLKRRERNRVRDKSFPMSPVQDDQIVRKPRKIFKHGIDDSEIGRLDQEVEAPTGELSLVFTDIVSSTAMWEMFPIAMRAAIALHNKLMRRHLRIIGGYEVKTEGDAFIVAFPTATSALLWCFTCQSQLLAVEWPSEILESVHGQEILDADGNVIYRGLTVRMGIHWGAPVCEPDPVTRRMDYFGPMVNRAARISAEASGGQINVSWDFISEIYRILGIYSESDRSNSTGSDDTFQDDIMAQSIRRDLRVISTLGFEVKEKGERKLKGLENPEYIYLMYPHSLAGRLIVQQQRADAAAAAIATSAANPAVIPHDSQLGVEAQTIWDLWEVSLRLEMICSSLECPGRTTIKPPETIMLERTKLRAGEVTDRVLVQFLEHLVSRIEVSRFRRIHDRVVLTRRRLASPPLTYEMRLTPSLPATACSKRLRQWRSFSPSSPNSCANSRHIGTSRRWTFSLPDAASSNRDVRLLLDFFGRAAYRSCQCFGCMYTVSWRAWCWRTGGPCVSFGRYLGVGLDGTWIHCSARLETLVWFWESRGRLSGISVLRVFAVGVSSMRIIIRLGERGPAFPGAGCRGLMGTCSPPRPGIRSILGAVAPLS
jgi:adenylate cyclase